MSGDPMKIDNAFVLKSINITEASELSFFEKILHPKRYNRFKIQI